MKLLFIIILAIATFQSCSTSSDDSMDSNQMNDTMPNDNSDNGTMDTNSGKLYMGDFMSGAHTTQGKATVNSEHTKLNFTNFKTDNGPVLNVYLATDTSVTSYMDLGALKGIEGDYEYDLPNNVDLSTYKYVIIWCVEYSVNFGYAVLE